MDALLALSALLTAAHAAAVAAKPVAHKHRKTHGSGPGANADRMTNFRLVKENERLRRELARAYECADHPDSLRAELSNTLLVIGNLRSPFSSAEAVGDLNRRRALESTNKHFSIMFVTQRCVLMSYLRRNVSCPELFRGEHVA